MVTITIVGIACFLAGSAFTAWCFKHTNKPLPIIPGAMYDVIGLDRKVCVMREDYDGTIHYGYNANGNQYRWTMAKNGFRKVAQICIETKE